MYVELGNNDAVERSTDADGNVTINSVEGADETRTTHVVFPDDWSIGQAFVAVSDPRGVWGAHASEGSSPAWVASDSEALASLLADHYKCPVGAPAAPAPATGA